MRSIPPLCCAACALMLALAPGPAKVEAAEHGHGAVSALPAPTFDYAPPAPGSYDLPPLGRAEDGAVLDENGEALHLRDLFAGHMTVLAFVYSRCTDICPLAHAQMAALREAVAADADLAGRTRLVSLSFDPAYDTPAVMAELADHWTTGAPASPEWLFLTTSGHDALAPILAAYDQPVARKTDPDDPTGPLHHLLRVFLVDDTATVRNIYSLDVLDPRLLLADLQTLAIER